jgi:M3 family oligoendopeptidase
VKFSEMEYKRADCQAMGGRYQALIDQAKEAKDADVLIALVLEHEKLSKNILTMSTLAEVRNTINTEDPFYKAEKEYYDENLPVLQEQVQDFLKALFYSTFKPRLEERFGHLFFTNMEMELKTFKPEIIPMLQEENKLTSRYQELIASAQIEFDGKVVNLSQLSAYKENPDREIRHGAYLAESGFFTENQEELDRIFDQLVRVRTGIAHELGLRNFTELGYLRMTRNCYNPSMVSTFRHQIIDDIVPLVGKLKDMQAERIGIDKLKIYDDVFGYKEGNPKPEGTPEQILAAGKQMYDEMSPETKEFIQFMFDNELFDVITKKGKAAGGYCTEFPDFKSPFIFANFNGTSGDVDVLTHEAGHAFAAYLSRDFELLEYTMPTYEACEVHSMSMEFIAWRWLHLFYGKDTDRAKFMHLESSLVFLPYGTMVDEFQHVVYDNPGMSPKERCEAWLALEKKYRPYMDFDDVDFYARGSGWQRQLHIYQYPFYYIDYCLAQTVALYFWSLTQKDFEDAWKRYMAFTSKGGTKTFVELCEVAGIKTPFEEGSVKEITETAGDWLKK